MSKKQFLSVLRSAGVQLLVTVSMLAAAGVAQAGIFWE
jgi:hypothetical protein